MSLRLACIFCRKPVAGSLGCQCRPSPLSPAALRSLAAQAARYRMKNLKKSAKKP